MGCGSSLENISTQTNYKDLLAANNKTVLI
jgi:hypothetical protein